MTDKQEQTEPQVFVKIDGEWVPVEVFVPEPDDPDRPRYGMSVYDL